MATLVASAPAPPETRTARGGNDGHPARTILVGVFGVLIIQGLLALRLISSDQLMSARVLSRTMRSRQRDPLLIAAMTRAFLFAHLSAACEVYTMAKIMEQLLTRTMHEGEPTTDECVIARIIGDVWLSNLVAWVTRRAPANDVANYLELAARLLR